MDFDLSPDHELIRRTVANSPRARWRRWRRSSTARSRSRTRSWRKLGALNLMGIPFPEEYGGGGGDTLAYALAVEELTRVDSSVAITLCAHTSLGTQPIYVFGSEEQKREWMPRLCSGERLGRVRADRAGGGLGRWQHAHARAPGGRRMGDRRRQAVHHQRRHGHLRDGVHHGRHRRDGRRGHRRRREQGDLEHHRRQRHRRLRAGRAVPQDGLERVRHAAADVQRLPRARGEPAGSARRGLQAVPAHPRHRPHRRGGDGRGARPGRARRRRCSTPRSARRSASRSPSSRRSRPSSRTCRREIEAARLLVYKAALREGRQAQLHADGRPGEAQDRPPGGALRARRPCRSTAATASSRSTPCAASIATPRSSRSARAPTRSSRW